MAIYPDPETVRILMDKTSLCEAIKLITNLINDHEVKAISSRTSTNPFDVVGVLLMLGVVGYAELCTIQSPTGDANDTIEQIKKGIGLINESLRSEK